MSSIRATIVAHLIRQPKPQTSDFQLENSVDMVSSTSVGVSTTLLDLPPEIMLQVLSFVGVRDLGRLARVGNRGLRDLACHDNLWRVHAPKIIVRDGWRVHGNKIAVRGDQQQLRARSWKGLCRRYLIEINFGRVRRHRKLCRSGAFYGHALTAPEIRRLARRGGVKRVSGLVYQETRSAIMTFLEDVIRDAVRYTEYGHRKTVTAFDIACALKRQGRTDFTQPGNFIYMIFNVKTKKRYIGQTSQSIFMRFKQHFHCINKSRRLHAHSYIRNTGVEHFLVFPVEQVAAKSMLLRRERFWMHQYRHLLINDPVTWADNKHHHRHRKPTANQDARAASRRERSTDIRTSLLEFLRDNSFHLESTPRLLFLLNSVSLASFRKHRRSFVESKLRFVLRSRDVRLLHEYVFRVPTCSNLNRSALCSWVTDQIHGSHLDAQVKQYMIKRIKIVATSHKTLRDLLQECFTTL
eukprot:TRINITY_DN926_c0_g1_i1.p1 TRINITY_DN926_c0_g1~~TRINITY_DN926_c0_g1_i1.p1  ORF type:complete len:466 (-),score=11.06 TRINITY_DN926_c0_g1_i1:3189-4586(-)